MNRPTRRVILAGAVGAPALLAARRRPNVVIFMTDDHSAWATGAYGCPDIHTPNVDRLAEGGARFTRAFACTPVCSPSRMTYMTGRLPSHHGVQDWLRPVDSYGEKSRRWLDGHPTWSEELARNGYRLGMSGKWHMGHDERAQAGFTWWNTVPGGGGKYADAVFVKNGRWTPTSGYKTNRVGDGAIEFLARAGDDPFCLFVPFYAPHTPYNFQPERYRRHYEGCDFSCYPDNPPHEWQNPSLRGIFGKREPKLAYSALVTGLDHNVGRVVRYLEQTGRRDDTLIIFAADQGWNAGHHGVWGKGNGTVPFNMFEESIRVPMIWNHPGRIAPGRQLTPLISSYDFMSSLLEYLGIEPPEDPKRVGRSYAPWLRGETPAWRDRLYFEYCYMRGVRTEKMKYVERTGEWPGELYNLERDPGETENLFDVPGAASERSALRSDMERFFQDAGAPPIEEWRTTTTQELTVYKR